MHQKEPHNLNDKQPTFSKLDDWTRHYRAKPSCNPFLAGPFPFWPQLALGFQLGLDLDHCFLLFAFSSPFPSQNSFRSSCRLWWCLNPLPLNRLSPARCLGSPRCFRTRLQKQLLNTSIINVGIPRPIVLVTAVLNNMWRACYRNCCCL